MTTPAAPTRDLPADTVVAGRYRITGKLGEGGMGAVYRAVQEPLGREVALKIIAPALAVDADAVARFQREAKAASSLAHPNIVTVYDFGADGPRLFLAMELLTGEPLDALVMRGPSAPARVVHIARGICAALAEAHARGIIHRDLKPQNVMLSSTLLQHDIAKVVDFGIAKMKDSGKTVTATGAIVGTPGYVAPELFDGKEPSPRSDLYALGVVLYELLCGQAPFSGKTPMEVIKASLFAEPPPTRVFVRDVPPELEALVRALLAKQPGDRPASAGDVDARLAALEASLPPPPPPAMSTPLPALTSSSSSFSGKVVAPLADLPPSSATEMAMPTPLPPSSSSSPSPSPSPSSSSSPTSTSQAKPGLSTGAVVGLTLAAVFIVGPILLIVLLGFGIAVFGDDTTSDEPGGLENVKAELTYEDGDLHLGIGQVDAGQLAPANGVVLRPLSELLPDAGVGVGVGVGVTTLTPAQLEEARAKARGAADQAQQVQEAIDAIVRSAQGGQIDPYTLKAQILAASAPVTGLVINDNKVLAALLGRHPFTLQWVSWDAPGEAEIDVDDNGVLTVHARQEGRGESRGAWAEIRGRIVSVDAHGFVVDGVAESSVPSIADGKVCRHNGRLSFVASGKRAYWRLQQMDSPCEGVTDYFDVYMKRLEGE